MPTADPTPTPTVTVAIVFFNAGSYLTAAVNSVLGQSYRDFELILIDDGSTDGSLDVARSFDDPRIRVISDGRNLRLNVRLNQSVVLARGEYYVRMDADDVMFPSRLERQVDLLRKADRNTVVGSHAICINEQGHVIGIRTARSNINSSFSARHAFIHPTVAARTEWFRNNRYSESFVFHRSQDAELWVRAFATSRFVTLEEPLIFYRERETINVENYVGSALGICVLAYRQTGMGATRRMVWISVELLKCWLILTACLFAKTGRIVRARNRAMSPQDRAKYEAELDFILGIRSQTVRSGASTIVR